MLGVWFSPGAMVSPGVVLNPGEGVLVPNSEVVVVQVGESLPPTRAG